MRRKRPECGESMDRMVRDSYAAYAIACAAWGADSSEKYIPVDFYKKVAKKAFDLADAMMAERKKRSK